MPRFLIQDVAGTKQKTRRVRIQEAHDGLNTVSPRRTSAAKSITVLLTDTRPLVLLGLDDLINASALRLSVSGHASSYAMALDFCDQFHPDIVLLSFFPDALDPLEVISALTRTHGAKVLVLKGLYDAVPIDSAINAGASGVVLAEDPIESITRAIVSVHQGSPGLTRAWTGGLSSYRASHHLTASVDADQARLATLTQREKVLICAVAQDPTAKYHSIAHHLGISEHTVHNHLSSIYRKLHLINRIDLLIYATKHGLANSEEPPNSTWVELH